jgi:hypothetical protein
MYAGTVALFLVANLTRNPQPNGTTEERQAASNTPWFVFSSTSSYLLDVSPLSSEPASASSTTDTNGTNDNNQLAFQHSGGFFDDISDSDWRRLQKITNRTFPNHFRPDLQQYSNHPTKDKSNWWNAENFQEEFHCQFAERLPSDSNGDGPKWVCDPHRIVKQYENKTFAKDDKNTGCLVYSVGSNGNVQFEKAVKDQISADCEVHTFDMRTRNRRNGNFKQALDGYSTFHNWGIGRSGPVKKGGYLKAMGGNLKTLEETVKILGHEGRRIDVFKIGPLLACDYVFVLFAGFNCRILSYHVAVSQIY